MRDPQSGFAEYRPWRDDRALARAWPSLFCALPLFFSCSTSAVELRASPPVSEPSAPEAPALAAPQPQQTRQISVTYSAPAECPDYSAYARHVADRSANLELEPEQSRLKSVGSVGAQVTLEQHDTGWVGHVRLAGFEPPDRQVEGERCEDVVAALALITVLRLERSRAPAEPEPASAPVAAAPGEVGTAPAPERTQPPSAAETSQPRPAANPAVTPARRNEPGRSRIRAISPRHAARGVPALPAGAAEVAVAPAPRSRPDVASPRPEAADPSSPPPERATTPRRVVVVDTEGAAAPAPGSSSESVELRLLAQAGYASVPSHALKLTLGGELRFGATSQSWITGLSLAYARGSAGSASGTATLSLLSAELDLCPPGVSLDGGLWLQPCAFVRGGVIDVSVAEGDRPLSSIDALRPWLALGPGLLLGLPLSSNWSLRAVGQVAFQLVRDHFDSERAAVEGATPERVTLYRPEAMSFELGLGLAYAF
jgi:hypothetical protein